MVEQLHQVGHRISYSLGQFISYILQLLGIHQSECLILSNRGLISGSILREWSNFVGNITEKLPPPHFNMLKSLNRTNSHLEERMLKITVVSGYINVSAL